MARQSYPSDQVDKLLLRFPEGMRDKIRASADMMGRSMNSEIIKRLERSLDDDNRSLNDVSLDLPGDTWNLLMADAHANGVNMDERAVQIIENAYHGTPSTSHALDKVLEMASENATLTDELYDLRNKENNDFVLYYNKALQLKQFAASVYIIEGNALPETIRSTAKELEALAEAEIAVLVDRKMFVDALQARKDNIAWNAEIATSEDNDFFRDSEREE